MNSRRREMAKWAAENLSAWPAHESRADADPQEIGCEFTYCPDESSLPVLRCKASGWIVSSTDYFYAKRSVTLTAPLSPIGT